MAETELKRVAMSDFLEVDQPDNLLAGMVETSAIKIMGPCELVRGELLMSTGENIFVSATKAGISTAKELCILADDLVLTSDEYSEVGGYFRGRFVGSGVIFSWETEESNHISEMLEVLPELRAHGIFINPEE